MAYQILIAGVDYTAYVPQESVRSRDAVEMRGDTLDFIVRIQSAAITRPQAGNIVRWADGATKEFEGVILSVQPSRVSAPNGGIPDVWVYRCRAQDYVFLLDRTLVKEIYPSQLAETTAAAIIGTYTTGFTTANIQTGSPTLPEQTFDYIPVSQALTNLARGSGWGWYVDFNRDIHFYAQEANAAPIPDLNLETDTTILSFDGPEETVEQIRNRVVLKDFRVLNSTPYTETFQGNGTARFFALSQEPSTDKGDVQVRVNGGLQTVAYDFVDSTPGDGLTASGQAFFCQVNHGIRFPDGNPLPVGATAQVSYSSYLPENLYVMDDAPSQADMQARLGENGIFEYFHNASELRMDNYDPIDYQGKLILSLYAPVMREVTVKTHVKGWQAGQYLRVRCATVGVDQTMYVSSVSKRPVTASPNTVTEYTLTLRTRPDVYL